MSNVQALRNDLIQAQDCVEALQAPVDSSATAVGTIKKMLNEPARLSKRLGKVRRIMTNLRKVSEFLSLFPYIGPIMRKVARLYKRAIDSTAKLKKVCDDVDKKLEKPKAAVRKLDKPLTKTKNKLDAAHGKLASSIAIVELIEGRFHDGLPPTLERIVGGVHRGVSPPIRTMQRIEAMIQPGLDVVETAGDAANRTLKPVRDVDRAVKDLEGYLGGIAEPLKKLQSLLKPLKPLLKLMKWFMDKLNDAIERALKLVGLDLDKMLRKLQQLIDPLAPLLAPLRKALNAFVASLTKIAAPRLVTQLEALEQATTALERELRPLLSAAATKTLAAATKRTAA